MRSELKVFKVWDIVANTGHQGGGEWSPQVGDLAGQNRQWGALHVRRGAGLSCDAQAWFTVTLEAS